MQKHVRETQGPKLRSKGLGSLSYDCYGRRRRLHIREIKKFQDQTKRKDCHEMFGLVILPNGYENQKRLLQNVGDKLRLGTEKLTWWDVADKNFGGA